MARGKQPKPIYSVIASDRLLRQEAVEKLLQSSCDEPDALSVTTFRGPEADLAEVLDDARTPSLLGGRRVVVVEDADEFITRHREKLETYAKNPAQCGTLVLLCQSMPSNTKLYKCIQETGEILSAASPKSSDLARWIVQRAQSAYGKTVREPVGRKLRQLVGDAPGLLDAELSKLATYVGDRPEITLNDVTALSGHTREEKVFAIMDAVLEGDTAEALRQWELVLATDRAAPHKALGGLAWSTRAMLAERIAWESGTSAAELARKHFVDGNIFERRLQRSTPRDLTRMQRDLLAADVAVKTGTTTPESAVEGFIVTHSTRIGKVRGNAR